MWFAKYLPEDQEQLACFIHDRVRSDIQEGWSAAIWQSGNLHRPFVASPKLLKMTALVGLTTGFGCGLALDIVARMLNADNVPSWTGSSIVDWALIGLAAGPLVCILTQYLGKCCDWLEGLTTER